MVTRTAPGEMGVTRGMRIRPATKADGEFIVSLSCRFAEISLMEWRDPERMGEAQVRLAAESLGAGNSDRSSMFIAESEDGRRLGFLHVTLTEDYFTGDEQAYIASLAVSQEAEGKGVASQLMATAEEWARQQGCHQLVLHVFASNERAVRFYEKRGFQTEILKMVKEL